MDERERLIERLRDLANIETRQGWASKEGDGRRADASYLYLETFGLGVGDDAAIAEALSRLAGMLLQVRDHVNLMLAPDIDPTKCQRLPTVRL